jgi:homoserine dehydrogenase
VRYAQSIGITETDPSADIDGWDAAIKVAALSTVLMGAPLKPHEIEREGIRAISPADDAEAPAAGERWKLVCERPPRGRPRGGAGGPERVGRIRRCTASREPAHTCSSSWTCCPVWGLWKDPGPETTAYGLLADLINAARGM